MSSPVLSYKDLSPRDIEDLTSFLSPHPSLSATDLPSHLLSCIPFLAPGCQRRKKLNLAPLDDLAGGIHYEAVTSIKRVWGPLASAGKLDQRQTSLFTALKAVADLPIGKCAACWLEFLGQHVGVLVSLGAFLIGRVNPGIYAKSKRIMWIEGALRALLPKESGKEEVRGMWELGMALREVRKGSEGLKEGRGYVDEFTRRAKAMDRRGSKRTDKGKKEVELDDVSVEDCFEQPSSSENDNAQDTEPLLRRSQAAQRSSQRSSIRSATPRASQASSAHSSWWNNSTIPSLRASTATSIIELYRHSAFPDTSEFSVRSSTDSRQRSPVHVQGMPVPVEEDDLPVVKERWTVDGNGDTIRQRREEGRGRGIVIGGLPYVPTGGVQRAEGWEVRRSRDGGVRCERGPLQ